MRKEKEKEMNEKLYNNVPPIGKCDHGVPFDSECGECQEDAMLVKAGKERSCSVIPNNYTH